MKKSVFAATAAMTSAVLLFGSTSASTADGGASSDRGGSARHLTEVVTVTSIRPTTPRIPLTQVLHQLPAPDGHAEPTITFPHLPDLPADQVKPVATIACTTTADGGQLCFLQRNQDFLGQLTFHVVRDAACIGRYVSVNNYLRTGLTRIAIRGARGLIAAGFLICEVQGDLSAPDGIPIDPSKIQRA